MVWNTLIFSFGFLKTRYTVVIFNNLLDSLPDVSVQCSLITYSESHSLPFSLACRPHIQLSIAIQRVPFNYLHKWEHVFVWLAYFTWPPSSQIIQLHFYDWIALHYTCIFSSPIHQLMDTYIFFIFWLLWKVIAVTMGISVQ